MTKSKHPGQLAHDRSTLWLLAILLAMLTGWQPAFAAPAPRLIVVLYPQNNDGSPGNFLVDQSIRATIAAGAKDDVEIYSEYLDVAHLKGDEDQGVQRAYLHSKYAGRKVDLVIAGLSSSLDYALAHRDIFSNAPIVFCAVDQREVKRRSLPADVVGVPSTFDLQGTLDLALRLHADTQHVAVVGGSSAMDQAWLTQARQVFQPYADRLKFTYLFGLPMDDLLEQMASLPEHTIVYYIHVFQDGTGKALVPAHVLESLSYRSNAPIYGHVDTYVGRGIVGGRVFRFETEGQNAARLALRILAGETPQEIGVQATSANSYLFDWRQLQRWNIDPQLLPTGSEIKFKQPSFWELYKWQAATAATVCLVQFILIVGLLSQRTNWKRAEQRLRQAAESLRASHQELRQLSGSLIGAQESERCRIARELHDDFNQSLAMLSVEIDLLRQSLPASAAAVQPKMAELAGRVRQLSSSIHELSHELHPLKLEQLGLVAAVRGLCTEFAQSHGLDIEFKALGLPDAVPPDTALCLYRIAQEGLRNVVKHSGALAASVNLNGTADEIGLTILDCGAGFDPQSTSSAQGLGFISMRERLRLVGGTLTINAQPNQGTQLQIHVPHSLPISPEAELQAQLDIQGVAD